MVLTWSLEKAVKRSRCPAFVMSSHSERKKKSLDSERQPKNRMLAEETEETSEGAETTEETSLNHQDLTSFSLRESLL